MANISSSTPHFHLHFWGVRGSYPTPGPRTLRHGGNTSCIEVQAGRHTLIFDAGSGIIGLGQQLMQEHTANKHNSTHHKPTNAHADTDPFTLSLFITHGHGDHLVGFPFFAPLFEGRANIHIFGPSLSGRTIEQLVTPIMSPPYFPVDIHRLPSRRTFHTIGAEEQEQIVWHYGEDEPSVVEQQKAENNIGADVNTKAEVRVLAQFTKSHPLDGALVYRVEYAGHSLVYSTDVEWDKQCDPAFLAFAQGTDVLIHDAQYTAEDYQQTKHGFGHSTVEMAAEVALAAHAKQLILFHHEPTYDDAQLDSMEAKAQALFPHTCSAYEGMELNLLAVKKAK